MRILLYLTIITMMYTMSSCIGNRRSKTKLTSKSHIQNEHYSDSLVYIEKIEIDTLVTPTEKFVAIVPKLINDTVIVYRSGRASTTLNYKAGQLSISTQCDSLSQVIVHKSTELTRLRNYIKASDTQEITAEKEVKPPWLRGGTWVNTLLILLILALIIAKEVVLLKKNI